MSFAVGDLVLYTSDTVSVYDPGRIGIVLKYMGFSHDTNWYSVQFAISGSSFSSPSVIPVHNMFLIAYAKELGFVGKEIEDALEALA